jgi:glycerophosphoryl diester phosphodiesterase
VTLVIGHGGASAVAPANTLESFDAALDAGADMIEFDVRLRRGELVLAHGVRAMLRGGCVSFDDALDHLGGRRFAGVGFNADVKEPGYERETLAALRAHGLTDRALVSSQSLAVIDRVRELDPGAATAISVGGPFARGARSWSPRGWRQAVLEALHAQRFGDLMLHHRLVDAEFIAAVERAGCRVYAWTVDDARLFDALAATGVAGIVTGDPHALGARRGC